MLGKHNVAADSLLGYPGIKAYPDEVYEEQAAVMVAATVAALDLRGCATVQNLFFRNTLVRPESYLHRLTCEVLRPSSQSLP